jgi:hypothetical protein
MENSSMEQKITIIGDAGIKLYCVSFRYFSATEWNYVYRTIKAISLEQLKEAVLNELEFMSEEFEQTNMFDKADDILQNVSEETLSFPIIIFDEE